MGGDLYMKTPEVAPAPEEQRARRIYITKKMVTQFGASAGCPGCTTVGAVHTEACRKRISDKIAADPSEAWRLREVEFRNEGKRARTEPAPSAAAAAAASTAASAATAAAAAPPATTQQPVSAGVKPRPDGWSAASATYAWRHGAGLDHAGGA